MSKHPRKEALVYAAVRSGELEIDASGRVWRLAKRTWCRWTNTTRTTPCRRVRAETQEPNGYMQVRAMFDGRRHYAAAHRLVWHHVMGPIPDGMTINHKNGVKHDNRPENLELATYSAQRLHAIRELGAGHADVRGERHPKAQTTAADVQTMRAMRAAGMRVKDIAARFGMRPKAVTAICTRRTWKHVP